jgi:hypothetical protein
MQGLMKSAIQRTRRVLRRQGQPWSIRLTNQPLDEASALGRHGFRFHYTPKHASWLNMAEIEIGILSRQCLDRRIASRELLQCEVDAWQEERNAQVRTIEWKFTRQDADQKLGQHYVSTLAC